MIDYRWIKNKRERNRYSTNRPLYWQTNRQLGKVSLIWTLENKNSVNYKKEVNQIDCSLTVFSKI